MAYIVRSYDPIYLDFSVCLVDSKFQVIEDDHFIYEGTLNDLFLSKAFDNFFREVSNVTGVHFDDPYGRVYFPPTTLKGFIEVVLKFQRRIFEGPEQIEDSIEYYQFEGDYDRSVGLPRLEGLTPYRIEKFSFKKSEQLVLVDALLNLVTYALEKNATLEISGP